VIKSIISPYANSLYQDVMRRSYHLGCRLCSQKAIFGFICFSVFLQDHGLPLRRRLILFIGFLKYYAAMKSGMIFLKRKSYEIYGCN
jgi:hypothetical protein